MTSEKVVVIVARGRTVRADGAVHGPGTELTFPIAEAQPLIDLGFVHRPGEQPIIPHVVAMKAIPEGMTEIGRVSEHHAFAADRGRFFTQR